MNVVDPVCSMTCEANQAIGQTIYKGTTYYFCAPGCKEEFERDPERYVGRERSGPQGELGA